MILKKNSQNLFQFNLCKFVFFFHSSIVIFLLLLCTLKNVYAECIPPFWGDDLGDKLAPAFAGKNTIVGDYSSSQEAIDALMGYSNNCLASTVSINQKGINGCGIQFALRSEWSQPEQGCYGNALIATIGLESIVAKCSEPGEVSYISGEDYTFIVNNADDLKYAVNHLENYAAYAKATVAPNFIYKNVVKFCKCIEYRMPIAFSDTPTDGISFENYKSYDPLFFGDTTEKDLGISRNAAQNNCNQEYAGNPVSLMNGNNIEVKTDIDFQTPFQGGLAFKRSYNSQSGSDGNIGFGWTHTYNLSMDTALYGNDSFIKISDDTGRGIYFKKTEAESFFDGSFEETSKVSNDYVWHRADGINLAFDRTTGKLISITDKNNNVQTLVYNSSGFLESVTDQASGKTLTFNYNSDSRIAYISAPVTDATPDGIWVTYAYDTSGNLTRVTYADDGNGSVASGFDYRYEDPNDPNNMTAKYDLAGNLISTWSYDDRDRAVENVNREGKGVAIDYRDPANVVVTDAYGISNTFEITEIAGRKKITAKTSASGCSACSEGIVRTEFDPATGFPTEREFANGRIDKYQDYDSRGNPGKRIIASNTAWENIITTIWHPTLEAPLTRTQKSLLADESAPDRERVVIWDYDDPSAPGNTDFPNENPTARVYRTILQGFTLDESGDVAAFEQVATYAYNSKGQVVSVDGPLDGTLDTITFAYDAGTGDLVSVTRPLAGAMTFTHDAAGNIITATDENQVQTVFSYDGRNRQTSAAAENASVTSTFTAAGEPAAQTDRTGRTHTLAYDTKGFLQRITNPSGNYLFYTYDENANPVESSIFSAGGVKTLFKGYDYGDPVADPDLSPGMPAKALARNQDDTATLETLFAYEHGNLIRITDPMAAVRSFAYDPLNRLVLEREQQDSDIMAEILYAHDPNGNLVRVTDPEGLVTSYTYDDANRLVKTISPDTGTTSYQYDAAGNLVSKQTGDGIRVTYTYDELGRRTGIQYPDPGENVVFLYDQGINGKGRLTGMSHTGDVYTFSYDAMGNLVTVIRTTDQATFTTTYGYDASGRLMSMTYPDGRTVAYERDADGNVTKVSTAKDGTTLVLADNMAYKPFGPLAAMTLGAGRGVSTEFDLNYRHLSRTVPGILERSLSYDPAGRIISIADQLDSTRNQNFGYDKAGRLTSATGPYGTLGFTYDRTGNRLTRTVDGDALTYTYTQGTNRLAQISGTGSQTDLVYDGAGKPLSKGDMNFAYTQAGRLATVSGSGNEIAAYLYNSLGQRTRKTVDGKTTLFHYDLSGNLIGESSPDGTFSMAYVYTDSTRLAALAMESTTQPDVAYYINDHLETPVKMIDNDGRVVWDGASLPFGRVSESLGEAQNHFRFPGQYYDGETDLHYNWHRYYDPVTGRYLTPDPIGLVGGVNPFAYASNNPSMFIDPDGQFFILGAGIGAGVGGLIGAGTAFFTGGDILAGAAGGAVAGAVIGSGAGLVVAAGSSFGTSGAVLTGAAIGAAGGASGNITSQVLGDRRSGQSWSQAYSNIDRTQLAISTSIGAAFGAAGGGLTSGTQAFQASSQAVQRTMANNINTISKVLYDMGASTSTVHAVQNSITQGMWGTGINTANILATISAMQAAGLPITESAILSYINDQVGGCP